MRPAGVPRAEQPPGPETAVVRAGRARLVGRLSDVGMPPGFLLEQIRSAVGSQILPVSVDEAQIGRVPRLNWASPTEGGHAGEADFALLPGNRSD